MIEADRLLAKRIQAREQEDLTNKQKAKLFVELLEKRRKHFAALREQEKRNRPPTKAQKRSQMYTYLKNMVGYKHTQLKSKSYNEIQKLFDKEMKRVNTFVAMNSEAMESNEKKDESKEVAIDAIPLATKPPCIVNYNIIKEGKIGYFQVIRADEKKRYPLTPATIQDMLNKKLQIDQWNEMSYQLLKLIIKQLKNPGSAFVSTVVLDVINFLDDQRRSLLQLQKKHNVEQRADEIRTRYHISPGSAAYSYASKMALQIGGFNLPEAGVGEPIKVPTKVLLSMQEESSKRRKVDEDVQDGVVAAYLHDRDAITQEKVLSNTIKQKRKEKAIKWNLPLPKVRIVAGEDEMCRGVRTGLSMGASNNMYTIRSLVAALCFHQFFEGMGLGSCILQADYKMKMKGILVFFFSVTTPLRIAFGILISNTKGGGLRHSQPGQSSNSNDTLPPKMRFADAFARYDSGGASGSGGSRARDREDGDDNGADFFWKKSGNAAVQAVYKKNCRLFPSDMSLGKIPLKDKYSRAKSVEKSNVKGTFPHRHVRWGQVEFATTQGENRVGDWLYVLQQGIVVLSVVIGLSMGASDNMCTLRSLVAALCFHQFFEGMGLGGCILQADYEMKMKGILVFFFSVTTPLGIAFGILLSNTKKIDRLHWRWSEY
ncbi:integrase, catalytic region, zinc finger, CCHC-type containing protein [Tanacetum coccineum]